MKNKTCFGNFLLFFLCAVRTFNSLSIIFRQIDVGFLGKFNLCLMLFKQVNFNNFVSNALLNFDLLLLLILIPLISTYDSALGIDV